MKTGKYLFSFLTVPALALCLLVLNASAQFNPNNFYSNLKILDRPEAPIANSTLVGRLYLDNGTTIQPAQLVAPVKTREVQSYGSVSRINNNNKNFNITSGITDFLNAEFRTTNIKFKVGEFTNVRLIEAESFYDLPITEGRMVVQALVVDGITTTRLNGDSTEAKAGLEQAIQKLAPTSGSVTVSNNTYTAAFGTNLIIAVKLMKVERINSPMSFTTTSTFGDNQFTPVGQQQRYIVNIQQYPVEELVPFGLKSENIYCTKFLVRNSAYGAVNPTLTTYCPTFAQLTGERATLYQPNNFWNRTIDVPSMIFIRDNNKVVKTMLTFSNPSFVINSANPMMLERLNTTITLQEQIFKIKRG